jgi:SpoIIAA-like
MSVDLHEEDGGRILVIKLTGKLTKDDYEDFLSEVEELVKQHGKLRILVQMQDFHGWTAGALWQDIKFDLKPFREIECLALVGEKAWERGMTIFCQPFITAKVRYFDRSKAVQAEAWVRADRLVAQG